jgi:hypothetical protein
MKRLGWRVQFTRLYAQRFKRPLRLGWATSALWYTDRTTPAQAIDKLVKQQQRAGKLYQRNEE